MADMTASDLPQPEAARSSLYTLTPNVARRRQRGALLRYFGLAAIGLVLFFLAVLLWSIVARGVPALWQYQAQIELYYDPAILNEDGGEVTAEEVGSVSLRSGFERGIFTDSFRSTVEAAGVDIEATVNDLWVGRAVETLDAAGLTGGAEVIAAAGAPADAAGVLGQTGNAIRAAATALGGDDADAAATALAAAQTALRDAGFADAADAIEGADADALAATGYQQALLMPPAICASRASLTMPSWPRSSLPRTAATCATASWPIWTLWARPRPRACRSRSR